MNRKKHVSITYKLASIFIIVLLSLIVSGIFTMRAVNSIKLAYGNITSNTYRVNDLINKNNEILYAIETFVGSRDREYIDKTYVIIQDFQYLSEQIGKSNLDLNSQMYHQNIQHIFEKDYLKNFDQLIYRMRVGDNQGVLHYFTLIEKNWRYTDEYLKKIINSQINESQVLSKQINSEASRFLILNQIILFLMMAIVGVTIYYIGAPIIRGLKNLSKNAEKVADGNFDVKVLKVDNYDEIGVLTIAFNKLIFNTRRLIKEIQHNAKLEVELHKNEAEKNRIQALLKEAELLGLQSQINPHFLFNTLNIIAKTAVLEDADETCSLIETASDMIRYNLRKIGESATLEEEIESIRNYFVIQKSRFSERFAFDIQLDEALKNFEIPFLTLQPLVENAFIHGIEPLERGGKIEVKCYQEGSIFIEVKDNGVGMTEDNIRQLLSNTSTNKGHTTGIGVANVQRRLMLFFDKGCDFDIQSEVNKGTLFRIKIYEESNNRGGADV